MHHGLRRPLAPRCRHRRGSPCGSAARSGTTNTLVVAYSPPRQPDAPIIGTATASDSQATVTFAPPAYDGGDPVQGYTVTANPGGESATGTGSPVTVFGLTNGVSYTFTVSATNTLGVSAPSAASNAVTPKASQYILFTNPGTQQFGSSPTLNATTSLGLTVSFASLSPDVCTITSAGRLTFVTAGTCTIQASQPGNDAVAAAASATTMAMTTAAIAAIAGIGVLRLSWGRDHRSATLNTAGWALLGGGTVAGWLAAGAWGATVVSLWAMGAALVCLAAAAWISPPARRACPTRCSSARPSAPT